MNTKIMIKINDMIIKSKNEEVKEALLELKDFIDNSKGNTSFHGFSIDDVITCASDSMEIELNEKEAKSILGLIERRFDASLGVNWDIIEANINEFVELRDSKIS